MVFLFPFQKGQIFKIARVDARYKPVVYHLVDLKDDPVPSSMYKQELTITDPPSINKTFIISKQGPIRTISGRKMVWVDYLHYPKKFSEWLPVENVFSNPEDLVE
jgi:hypothetical protein